MPEVFRAYGYVVHFFSNENNEPIHVHLRKGKNGDVAKFWLLEDGSSRLQHSDGDISKKDLVLMQGLIEDFWETLVEEWVRRGKSRVFIK